MSTLVVAAGGGGDAITGAALAGPLQLTAQPIVMTFSWDRLMVDPLPGPRSIADFNGLRHLAHGVVEVVATTTPKPPAGSSLPRLAAQLPARLMLLDPARGAVGMAEQVAATAAYFQLDQVALVDVGGDVLTDGADAGLRSPLADQLALASCVRSGIATRLLITGPGLDGELTSATVIDRLAQLDAESLPDYDDRGIDRVWDVFTWHPSEASGLLAAAASGRRGIVETRDTGDHIALTNSTTKTFAVDGKRACAKTPAALLTESRSLSESERIIREITGISEIEYETRKAARLDRRHAHIATYADLPGVDRCAADARDRGADFISMRRLAELLGATTLEAFARLSDLLATHRSDSYEPSLYRTRPVHSKHAGHAP